MGSKKIGYALMSVYTLIMVWLLFVQRLGQNAGSLNLQLFDTLRRYLWVLENSTDPDQRSHAIVNLVGNVAMFVPLGGLTPWIFSKIRKFGWHFLTMTLVIVGIELLQLLTSLGTCDIDDLLLNLLGTALGFGIWKWIYGKYSGC